MSTGSGIPVSPFIVVKAAGEMASAVAWRLYMANMRRICMLDLDQPLCVRRRVSFCPALESGSAVVEGVRASAVNVPAALPRTRERSRREGWLWLQRPALPRGRPPGGIH